MRFLGISIDENSLLLLLELMEGGDLKTFVRECRLHVSTNILPAIELWHNVDFVLKY